MSFGLRFLETEVHGHLFLGMVVWGGLRFPGKEVHGHLLLGKQVHGHLLLGMIDHGLQFLGTYAPAHLLTQIYYENTFL